jgi:ABC-type proline/glycine betaine transport system ATPase subunit
MMVLRMINRLVEPTEGNIVLNGRDVQQENLRSCGAGLAT